MTAGSLSVWGRWRQGVSRAGAWYVLGAVSFTVIWLVARSVAPPIGLTRSFYYPDYPRSKTDPIVEERITTVDLAFIDEQSRPTRDYRVRWHGVWFSPRRERVDFHAGADDGVVVRVDGETVLERHPAVGMRTTQRTVQLEAGAHQLEIYHWQRGGGRYLNVQWAPAGGHPGPLSPTRLFPEAPAVGAYWLLVVSIQLQTILLLVWAAGPAVLFVRMVYREVFYHTTPHYSQWIVVALPTLVLVTMAWERRWMSEDAFINLRIVRNVLEGYGPVFNLAERVEAHTSPLWIAILVVWGTLGLPLEVGALVLGAVFAVAGLLAAQTGARHVWHHLRVEADTQAFFLPLGAIVFVAIPAVWDFTTSGLESGLTFAWLGFSFLALAWLLTAGVDSAHGLSGARRWPWLAVACGISVGPLIRPDLAVFSVTYVGLLLFAFGTTDVSRRQPFSWVQLVIAAGALPVGYQVFRMGFYAAIVPNTALAKEVQLAHWQQGWRYAGDFVGTYVLAVPVLLLLGWWGAGLRRAWKARAWPLAALQFAAVFASVVHVLFVIYVGGDFMHGRLLLPGLFGLLLPVATVSAPSRQAPRRAASRMDAAAGAVIAWALVCAWSLRTPYFEGFAGHLTNERGYYVSRSTNDHPVRLTDYADISFVQRANAVKDRGERWSRRRLILSSEDAGPLAADVHPSVDMVVSAGNIGMFGYTLGSQVHVVDLRGLADPLASRLRLARRERPGHEKMLPDAWVLARFTDPKIGQEETVELRAARDAVETGAVLSLLHAIEEPLTTQRFFRNLTQAWGFHKLRIDPNPSCAKTRPF